MNKLLLLILPLFFSCTYSDPSRFKPKVNKDQQQLHVLLNQLSDEYDHAPNDVKREEIKKMFDDKINIYLSDTLRCGLVNFKVKLKELRQTPFNGKTALIFKCSYENVDYWMEQHFANEDSMKSSGFYKNLANFRENIDTTMSFIYLPKAEIEKDTYSSPQASIEVIPVTDSLAMVFQQKYKSPSEK
jgi:hypothetical protein